MTTTLQPYALAETSSISPSISFNAPVSGSSPERLSVKGVAVPILSSPNVFVSSSSSASLSTPSFYPLNSLSLPITSNELSHDHGYIYSPLISPKNAMAMGCVPELTPETIKIIEVICSELEPMLDQYLSGTTSAKDCVEFFCALDKIKTHTKSNQKKVFYLLLGSCLREKIITDHQHVELHHSYSYFEHLDTERQERSNSNIFENMQQEPVAIPVYSHTSNLNSALNNTLSHRASSHQSQKPDRQFNDDGKLRPQSTHSACSMTTIAVSVAIAVATLVLTYFAVSRRS